ncbi:MAG: magnesium transporter MgtE N-terminal domain-containing protein, partial [Candidatus Binatia bacterium]
MATETPLLPLVQKFFESDTVRAAQSLETMDPEKAAPVLKALPPTLAAQAFRHLQASHAAALLKEVSPGLFKEIVEKLDPQRGAAIFVNLAEESRKVFLDHLSEKAKRQIQELLTYPENSAGRIMTTEFLAFRSEVKVRDAIQRIRTLANRNVPASYTYIVDAD